MQRKLTTALCVSVILLLAVAVVALTIERKGQTEVGRPGPVAAAGPSNFDPTLPLEERIAALERAFNEERYVRQLLQDELFVLTSELEALTAPDGPDAPADRSASFERIEPVPGRSRRGDGGSEGRVVRLVEAGFAPVQAEWIIQRESELQMEALELRYEAQRSGDAAGFFRDRTTTADPLRNELGDTDYERYLGASGRATSVSVSSVLNGSPARQAGLRPGDRIVSYDGNRVFSMSDLTRQTLDGQPGEQVVVDILRDGMSMQVVVPRGPIGISGGRRYSR